jgi:hypothetical protein
LQISELNGKSLATKKIIVAKEFGTGWFPLQFEQIKNSEGKKMQVNLSLAKSTKSNTILVAKSLKRLYYQTIPT